MATLGQTPLGVGRKMASLTRLKNDLGILLVVGTHGVNQWESWTFFKKICYSTEET